MEYLNQCQGEIEVTLTIQSIDAKTALPYSENGERDYQRAWNRWLAEVDQLESSPSTSEPDEYGKALIEKHSKLGL
ncbi:hypothetical protein [Chroococcus sp. FPU101]|uniref:hypothetical protein n=1 Tax=Chroococcus sp. FPU101 TaxID=1974212 RepID=UPI001A8ECCB2|nr:hypothetical protein [Chroococcus sp. FPU101]